MTQGLVERVRQFPGQEKQVWEFYQKNPQALAEIRAPIFEEKVVDHILNEVKVEEEKVDRDTLFADEDEEGAAASEEKPKAKGAAKSKAKGEAKSEAKSEEKSEDKGEAKAASKAKSKSEPKSEPKAESAEGEEAAPAKKPRAKAKKAED